jgi:Ca-activated chloride channel family protein
MNSSKYIPQSALVIAFVGFCAIGFLASSVGVAQTVTPTVKPSPTASPTPEEDEGPIKIDTELVNLSVRVVDRNNRPVNNLKESDFKVFEDNIEQRIEFFSRLEVPTFYALVIDNSGSLRMQLEKVIDASKVIIGTNRPEDETSVIRFISSDKIEITQDFTSEKGLLEDALDNLYIEGGQTAITDAVYLAAQRVDDYQKKRDGGDRRRRALILVSDGEDRDSFYQEAQLFELLRESDVQIYTIGFVGDLSNEGGFISKSPQAKAKAYLERLSQETGGKAYFPKSIEELGGIALDIAGELRTQYSIGYLPPNDKAPDAYRALRVTVADGPSKEKRIAITRTGIKYDANKGAAPTLQNTQQKRP